METQQPLGKAWITDAIIIALVTAGAYLSALYYEIGFCDYYNIPHYLISLNLSGVLEVSWPAFMIGLSIVLLMIFARMVMEYLSSSPTGIFSMMVISILIFSVYFLIQIVKKNNLVLHAIFF